MLLLLARSHINMCIRRWMEKRESRQTESARCAARAQHNSVDVMESRHTNGSSGSCSTSAMKASTNE